MEAAGPLGSRGLGVVSEDYGDQGCRSGKKMRSTRGDRMGAHCSQTRHKKVF